MPQRLIRAGCAAAALLLVACTPKTPDPPPEPAPHPYLAGRALLGWAANDAGQVGDGTTTQRLSPVNVPGLDGIRAVAAGGDRSLALLTDGTVWQWGSGQGGPAPVAGLAGIVAIAAGERHALALTEGGQVYAWGANESGQLGDDSITPHASPVLVNNLAGVASIAAGRAHSVALRRDLTVAAWGADDHGQLGDGGTTARRTPADVPGLKAIEVATAYDHTLAISDGVHVLGWGDNHRCQLGENPPRAKPLDPVRCDDSTTPRDLGGNVSTSGNAIAASATATVIRTQQRGVEMMGALDDSPLSPLCTDGIPFARAWLVGSPEGASLVSGARHVFLIAPDGQVFGSGANNAGQLGSGGVAPRSCLTEATKLRGVSAAAAGGSHSLAVVTGVLAAAPASPIAFPSTALGDTSTATVTLTNGGMAPLAFYGLQAEGDFHVADTCPDRPADLLPAGTCGLTVTFRPTATGPRAGAAVIKHDGGGRTLRLELRGTATAPNVAFDPAMADFGTQRVGTTSHPPRGITVRNVGDAGLIVQQIQATAGFAVTATSCPLAPQAVPPGGSCTVDVAFAPLEARAAVGELTIVHNGTRTASMTLRGTGIAPSGTVAPASITFPPTPAGTVSAPATVTVTSTAALPLAVGTAVVAGDVQLATDGCSGTTLAAPGDTCTIEVRFAPTAAGARTGTLRLPTDGLPAELAVALEGTGT